MVRRDPSNNLPPRAQVTDRFGKVARNALFQDPLNPGAIFYVDDAGSEHQVGDGAGGVTMAQVIEKIDELENSRTRLRSNTLLYGTPPYTSEWADPTADDVMTLVYHNATTKEWLKTEEWIHNGVSWSLESESFAKGKATYSIARLSTDAAVPSLSAMQLLDEINSGPYSAIQLFEGDTILVSNTDNDQTSFFVATDIGTAVEAIAPYGEETSKTGIRENLSSQGLEPTTDEWLSPPDGGVMEIVYHAAADTSWLKTETWLRTGGAWQLERESSPGSGLGERTSFGLLSVTNDATGYNDGDQHIVSSGVMQGAVFEVVTGSWEYVYNLIPTLLADSAGDWPISAADHTTITGKLPANSTYKFSVQDPAVQGEWSLVTLYDSGQMREDLYKVDDYVAITSGGGEATPHQVVSTFSSEGLADGDIVTFNGYYAAGDGDTGIWDMIWHQTGRPVTPDMGFSIAGDLTDDWLEAVDKSVAHAGRFGCKDNDSGFDNTTPIQNMFDSVAKTIRFGNLATYYVSTFSTGDGYQKIFQLDELHSGKMILGNGSTIKLADSAAADATNTMVVISTTNSNLNVEGIRVRDLTLDGNRANQSFPVAGWSEFENHDLDQVAFLRRLDVSGLTVINTGDTGVSVRSHLSLHRNLRVRGCATGLGFNQRRNYAQQQPDWAPSTSYTAGDLVEYLDVVYSRNVTGTSDPTFNPADWTEEPTYITPYEFNCDGVVIEDCDYDGFSLDWSSPGGGNVGASMYTARMSNVTVKNSGQIKTQETVRLFLDKLHVDGCTLIKFGDSRFVSFTNSRVTNMEPSQSSLINTSDSVSAISCENADEVHISGLHLDKSCHLLDSRGVPMLNFNPDRGSLEDITLDGNGVQACLDFKPGTNQTTVDSVRIVNPGSGSYPLQIRSASHFRNCSVENNPYAYSFFIYDNAEGAVFDNFKINEGGFVRSNNLVFRDCDWSLTKITYDGGNGIPFEVGETISESASAWSATVVESYDDGDGNGRLIVEIISGTPLNDDNFDGAQSGGDADVNGSVNIGGLSTDFIGNQSERAIYFERCKGITVRTSTSGSNYKIYTVIDAVLQASSQELGDSTLIVNTDDELKLDGRQAWNTETNKPMWAIGPNDTDNWIYQDGTGPIIPAPP